MQFSNQPDGSSDGQDYRIQITDVPKVLSIIATLTPAIPPPLSYGGTGLTSFVRIWSRLRENQPEEMSWKATDAYNLFDFVDSAGCVALYYCGSHHDWRGRPLPRDQSFYLFHFSKPDLSNLPDVQYLERTTDLLENYTVVIVETSTFCRLPSNTPPSLRLSRHPQHLPRTYELIPRDNLGKYVSEI